MIGGAGMGGGVSGGFTISGGFGAGSGAGGFVRAVLFRGGFEPPDATRMRMIRRMPPPTPPRMSGRLFFFAGIRDDARRLVGIPRRILLSVDAVLEVPGQSDPEREAFLRAVGARRVRDGAELAQVLGVGGDLVP